MMRKQIDYEDLERAVAALWQILDDIDTYTDMYKAPDPKTPFGKALFRKLEERFKYVTSDGNKLFMDGVELKE